MRAAGDVCFADVSRFAFRLTEFHNFFCSDGTGVVEFTHKDDMDFPFRKLDKFVHCIFLLNHFFLDLKCLILLIS